MLPFDYYTHLSMTALYACEASHDSVIALEPANAVVVQDDNDLEIISGMQVIHLPLEEKGGDPPYEKG